MAQVKNTNATLTDGATTKPMTPSEIAAYLGIPVTQRNQPDMENHRPKVLVSLEEAKARGWSWFYSGATPCRYGHIAARRTSNPGICSDCERHRDRKEPIYPMLEKPRYKKQPGKPAPVEVSVSPAPTPAAPAPAAPLVTAPAFFEWTPAKHQRFIDEYVNTGLQEDARAAIGCSRAQLLKELRDNVDFAQRVNAAKDDAEGVIEESLIKAARAGQTAVLPKAFEIIERRALLRHPQGRRTPAEILARIDRRMAHARATFEKSTYRHIRTGALVKGADLENFFRDRRDGSLIAWDELVHIDPAAPNTNTAALATCRNTTEGD
jgi:hypothetical protein